MHLLHEQLARAQIDQRLQLSKQRREAAQAARARRMHRRSQVAAIRSRILRARFR